MKNKVLNLTYASSLTDLCEKNSSFDSGILRIAYPGDNRNKSDISKEVFERCIDSIYNCPVVCNYDRETDSLGGHDVELVHTKEGDLRLVNMTTPVGVIPQGAKTFWKEFEEENGEVHTYLCTEALIWKRQEAYNKIKKDGITSQSMEISVKDGELIDGIYHVYDFEFTAFALIGCEPCFESAALTFSAQEFKQQFSDMMQELKESEKQIATNILVNDKKQENFSTEGGEKVLDKHELFEKYGIDPESLDFSIDEMTDEELEAKLKEMNKQNYELTSNILEEVRTSLGVETIQREWGESSRYCFVDCDLESKEVYCWDTTDWLLYGFSYEMNGDNVVIDFESRKRKKYSICDFDEGEKQDSPFAQVYENMEAEFKNVSELKEQYQVASESIESMTDELNTLRKFKEDKEKEIVEDNAKKEIETVFERFTDLADVEAFTELKDECDKDCMKYSAEELEEKCYALRGRYNTLKFSNASASPKLPVGHKNSTEEPYNGIFEKYGFTK